LQHKAVKSLAAPTVPHVLITTYICLAVTTNMVAAACEFHHYSGSDSTVKIWDMSAKECVHSFDTAHTDQIWSVAYNHDGTQLVSAGDDGVLQIYDIAAA
jgi:WD40 repeat protein